MEKNETFDSYSLPMEIYSPTLPLVGLVGLDAKSKKSHQIVWDAFTLNRKNDRIPMKFVQFPVKLEVPLMKQKKQSYEWYTPKGILKSNWLDKYLYSVPSLLILFWDLEWSDPNWAEEKNKIAALFQSVKLNLSGRTSRIAVVLVQARAVNPGDDGGGTSEKAASLCSACDLAPKHLFVLPYTDSHLLGYTIRLENAFSEISGGFYMGLIKNVKSHQNFLNKTNHQLLFIRHQFKIAFFNEMRNDMQTAIKHYTQSYNYLLDHRFTNTNLHEIRTVSSIVNYKICKLNFALNLPRDAIEQFRKHIEVFRQRTGPKELIFEHYAWLSKQYEVFGHIFEEAVREGLPAVQTQHPGFYYQQSSHYAVLRRNTAFQVCEKTAKPETNLLEGWEKLEFYGQRPWRPGRHTLEPPEMDTESEGIKAICYHELHEVNHANVILPLFSSAVSQFKKFSCPRIKRFLMTQMASEYLQAKDPAKALVMLNHVMWDYRSERWFALLSSSSLLALQCAFQLASVSEYVAQSLETLGPRIQASEDYKESVLKNLIRVFNYTPPNPPSDMGGDIDDGLSELWAQNLSSSRAHVVVRMNEILPCFEVRAGFAASSSTLEEHTQIIVKIRNHLPKEFDLVVSLTVFTDSSSGDQLKESNRSKLLLPPSAVTAVTLAFQPSMCDLGKTVKITGVNLCVGASAEHSMTLRWTGDGSEGVVAHTGGTPQLKEFRMDQSDDFSDVGLHPQISISSRLPKMQVELTYDESALVWEWLPVDVELVNEEQGSVTDLEVSLALEPGTDQTLERTTQISLSSGLESKLSSSSIQNHSLPDLMSGNRANVLLYVKTLTATKRNFILKVSYKCDSESVSGTTSGCPTELEKSFSVVSKIPFQISIETMSMDFCPLTKMSKTEKFVVVPKIKCLSHVPVLFSSSSVALSQGIQSEGANVSQVSDTELFEEEEATDCFCLSLTKSLFSASSVSLGQYLLYWKRSGSDVPTVSVSIGLPSVTVEDFGLWVEVDLPPQGTVRTPLSVAYLLTNTGHSVKELAVSMHASDAFMFAGPKEHRIRILPGWQERIYFNLYPLLAGFVQLPRLNIGFESPAADVSAQALKEFIQRILPSQLFVLPQAKSMKGDSDSNTASAVAVR